MRLSPTNFVYNHIGHFAAASHAVAKGIFLGGVTRRCPQLHFAFLEGGVGSGSQLFGDLIEHWERRNAKALERMDPAKLDRKLLMDLVVKHGYDDMAEALRARDGYPNPEGQYLTGGREDLDDFAACKITRKEDWIDLYAKPYYFGCEADDRMNVCAFSRANPFGVQLNLSRRATRPKPIPLWNSTQLALGGMEGMTIRVGLVTSQYRGHHRGGHDCAPCSTRIISTTSARTR